VGGSGGTGGAAIECDPNGTLSQTPGTCDDLDATNVCENCIKTQCCTAWQACIATNPENPCGYGGPPSTDPEVLGEVGCYQDCVWDLQTGPDAGVPDTTALATCAGGCATTGCGTIADPTNDIIACLNNTCFDDCLNLQ
jgi:hypothetical protein